MKLQLISSFLRAVSQPARLEILLVIGSGEACVCHLEAATGQRQAYISQQLMALRRAGIVTSRREGRNIYYRLTNLAILDLIHQAAVIRGGREYDLPTTGPLNLYGECPCPNCEAEYLVLHKDGQAGNTSERI